MLMQQDAHEAVCHAIDSFGSGDWKICWLGCSAIWNLARPPSYRHAFKMEILDMLIRVLKRYKHIPKVVNTNIGAISNLALQTTFKMKIAENIDEILTIINDYTKASQICATAGGLLANLAVSDEVAQILVMKGALRTVSRMWKNKTTDENFTRNTVAVLSNCLTAEEFVPEVIRYNLVEHLYSLHRSSANVSVTGLIENCFQVLQCDPEVPVNSLHLACHHGELALLKEQLTKRDNVISIVNRRDRRRVSLLMYAASGNHLTLVRFLVKCGAETKSVLSREDISPELEATIDMAEGEIANVRAYFQRIIRIYSKDPRIPEALATLIASFLPPFDMFKVVEAPQNTSKSAHTRLTSLPSEK